MSPSAGFAVLLAPVYDHGEYWAGPSLGLRTVAAALAGRGATVRVIDECRLPLPGAVQRDLCVASLVGLGVLFTKQIPDALDLVRAIRREAATAHITAGGQGLQSLWATVLHDCPELDSSCAYEADETIVEVWTRLVQGQPVGNLRGLYTRSGSNIVTAGPRAPVVDLDSLPCSLRDESRTTWLSSIEIVLRVSSG